jgi:hypothetical protein
MHIQRFKRLEMVGRTFQRIVGIAALVIASAAANQPVAAIKDWKVFDSTKRARNYIMSTDSWVDYRMGRELPTNFQPFAFRYPPNWKNDGHSTFEGGNGRKVAEILGGLVSMKEGQSCFMNANSKSKKDRVREFQLQKPFEYGTVRGSKFVEKIAYDDSDEIGYRYWYCVAERQDAFVISFFSPVQSRKQEALFDSVVSTVQLREWHSDEARKCRNLLANRRVTGADLREGKARLTLCAAILNTMDSSYHDEPGTVRVPVNSTSSIDVSVIDLNHDGQTEVLVTGGGGMYHGGALTWLFSPRADGTYHVSLGLKAFEYETLETSNFGYPDFRFDVNGKCSGVWRRMEVQYAHLCNISNEPGGCARYDRPICPAQLTNGPNATTPAPEKLPGR